MCAISFILSRLAFICHHERKLMRSIADACGKLLNVSHFREWLGLDCLKQSSQLRRANERDGFVCGGFSKGDTPFMFISPFDKKLNKFLRVYIYG